MSVLVKEDPMSYSQIIDEGMINTSRNTLQSNNSDTLLPNEIKLIQRRKIHVWIRDEAITNCYKCKDMFTFYNRKHHCRACGRIFCNTCSNTFIDPDKNDNYDFPAEIPKTSVGILIEKVQSHASQQNVIRICKDCNETMTESKIVEELFLELQENSDVVRVNEITNNEHHTSYRAGKFYLSKFREIQYRLPFRSFDTSEEKLLRKNKNLFGGHSQWIYQLIMSIDTCDNYNGENDMIFIEDLLKEDKKYECKKLMCSSQCKSMLSPFQVCNILLYKQNLSTKIIELLVPILDSIKDDILDSYLMMFTNRLIEENITTEKPLTNYIFGRASASIKTANDFVICLNSMRISDDRQRGNIIGKIKKSFLDYLLSKQEIFLAVTKIEGLLQSFSNDRINETYIRNTLNNTISATEITLPFKVDCLYKDIDVGNIQTKNSKYMPILIPFNRIIDTYDDNVDKDNLADKDNFDDKDSNVLKSIMLSPKKSEICGQDFILFKKDDLRQDYIICKIIKLMMNIIKEELDIDINLVSYDVVPLDKYKGLIEYVPNSETINDIGKKQFTILNHILEHNKEETTGNIRDNFCKSTAAYCIITYLLGIEDRHLDNIMIHDTGKLFHVDFGYILGCDPKFISSDIRITPDMLDALGGTNSQNYTQFCDLCVQMYNTIRKHASFFSHMLLQLSKINGSIYTIERIEAEVTKRFEPGVNNIDGKNHLINLLTKNQTDNWKYQINDFVHSALSKISIS